MSDLKHFEMLKDFLKNLCYNHIFGSEKNIKIFFLDTRYFMILPKKQKFWINCTTYVPTKKR